MHVRFEKYETQFAQSLVELFLSDLSAAESLLTASINFSESCSNIRASYREDARRSTDSQLIDGFTRNIFASQS